MGYTTKFYGSVSISPALNEVERAYLNKFADSRRMRREKGPYFAAGSGFMGQGLDADIRDFNAPPEGQPGLWCKWRPTDDGAALKWDGRENFYAAPEWMQYLIDHFLRPGCFAREALPFLQANHTMNGTIEAQGEDPDDVWRMIVEGNVVFVELAGTSSGKMRLR